MTNKEMSEIFSVMLLAWPNAEIFRGGIERLSPTIRLWTSCTADVDFWTGQQAVYRMCKTSRFPPTIAEFREQAAAVESEIRKLSDLVWFELRGEDWKEGALEAYCEGLPQGSFTKAVVDAAGGPGRLKIMLGGGGLMWDAEAIRNACRRVLRRRPALIGGSLPALADPKKGGVISER